MNSTEEEAVAAAAAATALIAGCGSVSFGVSVGGSHDNNNGGDAAMGEGGRRWAGR